MTKDLTQGKITPLLVKFTIPLLFGNIFQLMYNSVDSIIVGQLVGKEALAAVGTSNPLMTLAILFVNGMCIGASILMGTQYGAKKMDVLKRQISTTMMIRWLRARRRFSRKLMPRAPRAVSRTRRAP